jgi:hypothetical protein
MANTGDGAFDRAANYRTENGGTDQNSFREKAQQFREEAKGAAQDFKEAGASQIGGISRAVHGMADELGREMPQAADYIHSAAERLDGVSTALREQSLDEIMSNFTGFARRQPFAVFAGSVVAGLALSRFLKSSAERSGNSHYQQERKYGQP